MTQKRSGKKVLYIAIVAILLAVIGVLVLLLLRQEASVQQTAGKNRDPNAAIGHYEGKTQEEIQAELNRIVEEGMFNISISPAITMENGGSEAALRIENIEANHYLMRVEITLDDTGEVLYTSGLIEPGYHIQSVPLNITLEKGVYAATAVFTAYDEQTEASAGQAVAKITITVNH